MTAKQASWVVQHRFGVTLPVTADLKGMLIADLKAVSMCRCLLGVDECCAGFLPRNWQEERGAGGAVSRTIGFVWGVCLDEYLT